MPGAIVAMRELAVTNELIVFTGRRVDLPAPYTAVQKWLEFFQIPYHGITNVKPERYDLIIDNRAMHFDRWPTVLNRIWHLNIDDYVHPPVDNYEPDRYKLES